MFSFPVSITLIWITSHFRHQSSAVSIYNFHPALFIFLLFYRSNYIPIQNLNYTNFINKLVLVFIAFVVYEDVNIRISPKT